MQIDVEGLVKISRVSIEIEHGALFVKKSKLDEHDCYYDSSVGDIIVVRDKGKDVLFEIAGSYQDKWWLLRIDTRVPEDPGGKVVGNRC